MQKHLFNSDSPSQPPNLQDPSSSLLEQRYRLTKVGHVVFPFHDARTINSDHVRTRLGAQCPEVDLATALNADHVELTALGSEARLPVVVEKAIQASAIDKDIGGSENAYTPRFFAASVAVAIAEVGIEVGVARLEAAVESCGIGLHVWCFALEDTGIDIFRIGEFKIVELAVFGAGAVHPDWSLGFDEDAAAIVDVDLVVIRKVELVVSDPHPIIFEVNGRFGGNMQEQKGTFTVRVVVGCDGGVLGAGVALQASPGRATDAKMDVPHARRALRGFGNVPLNHDCAWGWTFSLKDEITHLDRTSVTWLADLKDGSW